MPQPPVFAQMVLFNSASAHGAAGLEGTLRALGLQSGFTVGRDLLVEVHDNGSSDGSLELLKACCPDLNVVWRSSPHNLGFCGAYNRGARLFLDSQAEYFLLLNPDLRLELSALQLLVQALERDPAAGSATPRLMRAGADLEPVKPSCYDAAGMYVTPTLRHFDRGSGEHDHGQYSADCYVFGGTGACLLLRRACVAALLIDAGKREADVDAIYPQLAAGRSERVPLFDEAFFAYRDDADLAWRAQLFGWRCRYVAAAVGYHERVVLPERRAKLAPELNLYSVRNRFLLQLNNRAWTLGPNVWWHGILLRNLLVVLGVLVRERRSLAGLLHVLRLWPRAAARRREIRRRSRVQAAELRRWFKERPYVEEVGAA